ncbi:MAG: zinc-binding dehydrogenase, partial [Methanotrichaceae archaeon]|nr:zinc-binding dehydrogenase [Methanotrichaceae archaeon]
RKDNLWSPAKQRGKRRRPGGNPRSRRAGPSGPTVCYQALVPNGRLITRDKEVLARKLGAHHFIDTTTTNAAKELMNLGGAKVILCTAPNGTAISELISGLGRNGQMIIVSYVNEMMQISPGNLMRGNRSICGSVRGDPEDA